VRSNAKPWSNRYRRSTDVKVEWMVVSKPAEAPFESGSGKAVSAERVAEQVLVAVSALETSFRALGLLGTGGMGKEDEDIAIRTSPCEGGTEKVWGVGYNQWRGAEVARVGRCGERAVRLVRLWLGRRRRVVDRTGVCGGFARVFGWQVAITEGY